MVIEADIPGIELPSTPQTRPASAAGTSGVVTIIRSACSSCSSLAPVSLSEENALRLTDAEDDVENQPEKEGAADGDRKHPPAGARAFVKRNAGEQEKERERIAQERGEGQIKHSDTQQPK